MNVSLTPQLEAWVQEKVASGRYSSASEVVREALRMFQEEENMRREVQRGIDQVRRGEGTTVAAEDLPAYFEKIKREGRARLKESQEPQGE